VKTYWDQRIAEALRLDPAELHPHSSDPARAAARPAHSDFDLNPHFRPADPGTLKPAAVLVPLLERPDDYTVLLTRRADHLPSHAGQVSFPGGRVQAEDESLIATALRETEEEVGIPPQLVEVAGLLDPYETVTAYSVLPVVGYIRQDIVPRIDTSEVAEAFEVPLSHLMDPKNHERHSRDWQGQTRHFYVIPYKRHYIWGATAAMLVNMARRLGLRE